MLQAGQLCHHYGVCSHHKINKTPGDLLDLNGMNYSMGKADLECFIRQTSTGSLSCPEYTFFKKKLFIDKDSCKLDASIKFSIFF